MLLYVLSQAINRNGFTLWRFFDRILTTQSRMDFYNPWQR